MAIRCNHVLIDASPRNRGNAPIAAENVSWRRSSTSARGPTRRTSKRSRPSACARNTSSSATRSPLRHRSRRSFDPRSGCSDGVVAINTVATTCRPRLTEDWYRRHLRRLKESTQTHEKPDADGQASPPEVRDDTAICKESLLYERALEV